MSTALATPANEELTDLGPAVLVAIGSVQTGWSPRSGGCDPEHVRALALSSDRLTPILVHRETMQVIDGHHRLEAAKLRGRVEIEARLFSGDETDAFVLSVRSNVEGGLPLALGDRKAAATRIITSRPHWSDRLIASLTGLSPKTIAEVRRDGAAQTFHSGSRVGRDGRVRPINSVEKRRIASNLILNNPSLSLRQIARGAGISPETARAVRTRLMCGEDPVLVKRRTPANKAPAAAEPKQVRMSTPDWFTVVNNLGADPSLRYTDTGRALLRLLSMHAMGIDKWASMVNNVPAHSRPSVAKVALECARVWRMVAEHLEHNANTPRPRNRQA